jgi:outer membrane murein-binding lipoprotein Lpp
MATITASISPLFLLACPISMVLMMVFMGMGMMGGKKKEPDASSVEELKADHDRLSAEVERLEREANDRQLAERR